MKHTKLALALILLAPLAACGSGPTARRYDDVLANSDRRVYIDIHGDILDACDLDGSRTYFGSGSAELGDDDRRLIHDVSHCLTSGRLAGRSILVSGYTDSIGTPEYNKDLGMLRAKVIAVELNTHGVLPIRIYLRSRGERVASGDDAGGRALDRKVELRLVTRDI